MTESQAGIRVAYIAGYGRSGSTVFDIILGAHPQVVGVGELTNLSRRVWPNNEYCSCGARVHDCPFWSPVVERFFARFGRDALSSYARLQTRHERLDVVGRGALGIAASRDGRDAYDTLTLGLYTIVAEISGRSSIVDSSKLPGRAVALMRIPSLDLRLIHLVRDGRGVAWSIGKAYEVDHRQGLERPLPARSVTRTALRWAVVNVGTEWVAGRIGPVRSARLRYEDFVTAPARELERVGTVLGMDVGNLVARLEAGESFRPGHIVAGSRWRMAGPLKLRLDQEWRRLMPGNQRRTFQLICGWLQRRYGYA